MSKILPSDIVTWVALAAALIAIALDLFVFRAG